MNNVLEFLGEVESVLLALVVVALTTWTLIIYSWVQNELQSRFCLDDESASPCKGRQKNPICSDKRAAAESIVVRHGPVNYYITYKCTFFKRTVTSTPKVRDQVSTYTDVVEGEDNNEILPCAQNSTDERQDSCKRCAAPISTSDQPESCNTSFEILSLSEIAS
ncbi:uncharacterized protein LOC135947219 [Cloeon dipterum]|uniref:uncharacterized protein LOC135947219 n=1 Tax=Cloeon dipterum TaxID=197152 RepID=UPI00321F6E2F